MFPSRFVKTIVKATTFSQYGIITCLFFGLAYKVYNNHNHKFNSDSKKIKN